MSLKGSPEKLAGIIIEKELNEYISKISEAYEAAVKLLKETKDKETARVLKQIDQELSKAEERIKSEESSLELQLKTAKSKTINDWVDKILSDAVERALKEKDSEWYQNYMKTLVNRLVEEAGEAKYIVKTSKDDAELVSRLIKRAGAGDRLLLSKEHPPIMGGLIAESEDVDIVLDYSFELFLENIKPKIRSRIARLIEG